MNTFFKITALAGLLAIAGHAFAVDDITRADQIPVLKEEPQHATVSERVTSRFTRSHYRLTVSLISTTPSRQRFLTVT